MSKERVYAIYKGDEFVTLGTKKECAEYLGVNPSTISFMATPTHRNRNTGGQRMEAILLEDEEDHDENYH